MNRNVVDFYYEGHTSSAKTLSEMRDEFKVICDLNGISSKPKTATLLAYYRRYLNGCKDRQLAAGEAFAGVTEQRKAGL